MVMRDEVICLYLNYFYPGRLYCLYWSGYNGRYWIVIGQVVNDSTKDREIDNEIGKLYG